MKCLLGEIAEVTMGQSPKSEYYNNDGNGIPFLQGNRTFGRRYPTFDTYTTLATKMAKAGDVIMSVRAPVGDLNFTPVDMCLGRGVCSIRMNNGNQDYLYYLLKYNMPLLLNKESGTVFGSVNRNDIIGLEIEIEEDANKQREIARYLSMLDDKIEENEKINSNLEQQAQAIFKSWFVDFEPYGGVMPFDWQVSTLGKISDMSAGGDKPDITSEIETENCRVPIYSNGITEEGLYGYTDKARIFDESVTVSARGTIGYVCLRQVPYVPIVRLISLIPKKELVSAKYLYLFLKQLHIAGTGTTQQQLTVPNFKGTEILIPTSEIMSKFTDVVNPFYEKILDNKAEIKKLCSLRDTLLPKLMSGEIDLSSIDI